MLFDSSLRRELARSFGATLLVLGTVVMTMMLIRTLSLASKGTVSPSDVTLVMGYTLLGHLPTLLALSLFIASVGTLSRMQTDSEMVIWSACGRGPMSLLGPLLRFAWPVLVGVAVLAMAVWPWSNQQVTELRERFEQRADVERIAPGQFQESANGSRVFFVDKDSGQTRGNNVFISSQDAVAHSIISAQSARIQAEGGDRFLVLENGQRVERRNDGSGHRVSEFDTYRILIGDVPTEATAETPPRARSTLDLLREPSRINQGELSWRLGLVLAAINLVMLSLVVSFGSPRAGRSANLVFALFAFIVYYNLLNLGQNWIATGRVGLLRYMLGLHAGVALALFAWLLVRQRWGSPLDMARAALFGAWRGEPPTTQAAP
jgi:lipopolysaccharide export system permease protein